MPDDPVHPDSLSGPALDAVVAMFGDINWANPAEVERRRRELKELTP